MNIWSLIQRAQRRITRLVKRLRDYSFFRDLGHGVIESWDEAGRTL